LKAFTIVRERQIGRHCERSGEVIDELLQAFGPSGGHHDRCTDGVQDPREVRAETRRRTGHDDGPAVETEAIEWLHEVGHGIGHGTTPDRHLIARDRVSNTAIS
jgi:hypothetical protein